MANVVTRRIFNRSLLKLRDITQITKHTRCTSIFSINFNCNGGSLLQPNQLTTKSLQFFGNDKIRLYSSDRNDDCEKKEEKLSLFQRFKQMYKNYWYVLVPVHLVTSAAWFGGFYYLAKSGVDIVGILEAWNFNDKIVNRLRDSSMGYIAVAYALYKIATPARYTVTLGGTTISINYLRKWGYIKPVPSKERLKEIYIKQKDNLLETMRETKEGLKIQSEKLKDKKENIIEDLDKSIKQIKEIGEKVKSKEHVEGVKKKEKEIKCKG